MRTILLAGVAFAALTSGPVHAQFSDNFIKIGVLTDRSGIYSDINGEGSVVAARLAAEEFGNKVAGAPIEIITGDHQNKADIAANLVRGWIDTDKVDVVADVPNSAAALAVQGITKDNKRIFLMSGPGSNLDPDAFDLLPAVDAALQTTRRRAARPAINNNRARFRRIAAGHAPGADQAVEQTAPQAEPGPAGEQRVQRAKRDVAQPPDGAPLHATQTYAPNRHHHFAQSRP